MQGPLEIPSWVIKAIIVTPAVGSILIFAIIVASRRQRTRKIFNDHKKDRHLK
jgi:hypothetical protein